MNVVMTYGDENLMNECVYVSLPKVVHELLPRRALSFLSSLVPVSHA